MSSLLFVTWKDFCRVPVQNFERVFYYSHASYFFRSFLVVIRRNPKLLNKKLEIYRMFRWAVWNSELRMACHRDSSHCHILTLPGSVSCSIGEVCCVNRTTFRNSVVAWHASNPWSVTLESVVLRLVHLAPLNG